ncbi:cell division protein FtsK [Mammaliicoccus sciuri]|uniref:DNA translocase FtsK n=1 Tax=Mammaliicoccus sciuri TaxID=1296 RepID=UPI000734F29E|nr:DNA translocase FtsK [Mammaliicoccus sciuri]KTT83182.1 cell division protein FtsK [Mammaliicoccus sciuri]KTT90994.1 cell division protein FtsK [Mammaliicoccus sciuri]KTT92251.1 cell division protein FtsK [Mammaliicoccus sciuri]KTT94381.1 cell division protein FtsK [Mammaliicoccus sciuri]KTW13201.1 cell division protein FtsK [Mammaliicoccus sciuri]
MVQKKKPATRKRKTTRGKKKQKDNTLKYVIQMIVLFLLVLGIFQLGFIGLMIDSFFHFLFGFSKYFTYILIAIISLLITVNGKLKFTRRVNGLLVFQIALLFIMQLVLYFKDPSFNTFKTTLSETYSSLERNAFYFNGGGYIGYYAFNVISKLISVFGYSLLTILVLLSSVILIMKKRHRDITKSAFDMAQSKTKSKMTNLEQKREEKAKAKQLEKEKRQKEQPKDVSHLEEVEPVQEISKIDKQQTNEEIPIFESQEKLASKRTQQPKQPVQQDHDNHESEMNESTIDETENLNYKLPPITILNDPPKSQSVSKKTVQEKGKLLEATLRNFNVDAKVTQIRIGPAVTQYEVQPAQGVKVNKIVNLSNDIALNLAAKDIRIEAPIPGKSAVGIEVPNEHISMVTLKEVLNEAKPTSNKLEVALGRDISGEPITAELNKLPHLLVAGATGSGKSVCINGIITSILMNAKPHEVKLMLIDPKMVELNVYNGIPHLLTPVVTNPQKANQALQKIVSEMEKRYDLFQHVGARNIEGYNQFIERTNQEMEEKQAQLPYIVVIVDELADLMMVAGKDVESSIMRIAQLARAAGIHLIIATQRPSVDVITGSIKANIPSRIAFAVSSATDSRTILDSGGAEKLLGRGDMLFLSRDSSKPTRIQGAFLSDGEVESVVQHVIGEQTANYVKEMEPDEPTEANEMESEDALYKEAYLFVVEEQKASASLLQRRFRIGYNRASRLMDDLESNGVIGPQSGSKPRQVLVDIYQDE